MSDFAVKMKELLVRSAKFIGRIADATAKATRYKLNEISVLNKRRELIANLGKEVFALCEQGLSLPEKANEIVVEIKQLDEALEVLRANHSAEKAAAAEQHAMEKAARTTEKATAKVAEAIDKSTSTVQGEMPIDTEIADDEATAAPVLEMDIDKAAEETESEIPTLNL